MATVWAWRRGAGIWSGNDPVQTGWSHQIEFSDLKDLLVKLNGIRPSIKGSVTKLGIAAHGDAPGVVEIGPVLSAGTAGSSGDDLRQLNDFLAAYARLIFFSCIAGASEKGTAFLNLLSGHFFPHRHVIGFEVFGLFGRGVSAPGAVNAADSNGFATAAGPIGKNPRLSEYSWYAKWSLDGRIIRRSANDQGALVHSERFVVGVKAVEAMLANGRSIDSINYIAIEGEALRSRVAGLMNPRVLRKVKVVPTSELTKLAGTSHHQGIVGVWDKEVVLRKCADPNCPGHAQTTDFCEAFANQFPNGPLK